jgi:hypothetical protein
MRRNDESSIVARELAVFMKRLQSRRRHHRGRHDLGRGGEPRALGQAGSHFHFTRAARARSGLFSRAQLYAEIRELVTGNKQGRERADERILIHTTGLVSQDVALAHFLYQCALETGRGMWLPAARQALAKGSVTGWPGLQAR